MSFPWLSSAPKGLATILPPPPEKKKKERRKKYIDMAHCWFRKRIKENILLKPFPLLFIQHDDKSVTSRVTSKSKPCISYHFSSQKEKYLLLHFDKPNKTSRNQSFQKLAVRLPLPSPAQARVLCTRYDPFHVKGDHLELSQFWILCCSFGVCYTVMWSCQAASLFLSNFSYL